MAGEDEFFTMLRTGGLATPDSPVTAYAIPKPVSENVIVTSHSGAIEWLRRQGIEGDVIPRVSENMVRGKTVYGFLPPKLAQAAKKVIGVEIPYLPSDKVGLDLTADEMEEYGARLVGVEMRFFELRGNLNETLRDRVVGHVHYEWNVPLEIVEEAMRSVANVIGIENRWTMGQISIRWDAPSSEYTYGIIQEVTRSVFSVSQKILLDRYPLEGPR